MNLQERSELLIRLGEYMQGTEESWQAAKYRAHGENNWFIPEFIELSVKNIVTNFLQPEAVKKFAAQYAIPEENTAPKKVGVVLAGNIPLVGFHDVMCIFLSGHYAIIKPSSKDSILIKHLLERLIEWKPEAAPYFVLQDLLKSCDAYIATGSNNTARYFEHYFQKYPHIIRRNRTSVAILDGSETAEELESLSDDICQFFGLGCRNVTKLFVPKGHDFVPLIGALNKYDYLINHNKYKNNYDHNLAMHILNNQYYMTNGSVLLIENTSPFSPISQVHYEFYTAIQSVEQGLADNADIQCIVGHQHLAFGQAQCPAVDTFADNVDTLKFLLSL
ncbi:MAG: acyl-CoA reductase [Flaviaesturariibacter sp.]|nr:acyl-CoA reductase [Flaviaesturariibacter sp.]